MTIPASDVLPLGGGTLQDCLGFETRSQFVAWAQDKTPPKGVVIQAGGLSYRFTDSGTYLSGLPGWVPEGIISPAHFDNNATPGATDMTSALRRAFDYLIASGGGVIDGRCEKFAVWGQVNLPSRSNVRCLRCTFIAINTWDPEVPIFRIAATSRNITFEDCVVEGSHKANGWLIDNAAAVQILRCRVHGVPDYAVRSRTKATELRIEGCDFRQWDWGEGDWNVAARRTARLIDLATADYMVMRNVCAYAKECIGTANQGPGQIHGNHFYNGSDPALPTVNGTLAGPNVSFVGNYIDNGLLRIDAEVISGDPAFPGANPAAIFVANHFHKNGNGGNAWLVEFFNGNASNLSGAVIANNTFTTVAEAVHFSGTYVPDDQKRWVVSGNISGDGAQVVGLPDISVRGSIVADGHVSVMAAKSVTIMADSNNNQEAADSIIRLGTNGTEYHRIVNVGWWGFGMGQAAAGGPIAYLGWNGDNFLINPSNGIGGTDNTKQFTYDVSKSAWQFKAPLILAALADAGDATKKASFALGGIASGSQVTVSLPNASGTMLLEGQPIGATTPASVRGSSLTSMGLVTSGTSFLEAVAPGALGFGAKEFVFVTPTASGSFTTTVPPAGTRCTLVVTTSGTTSRNLSFGSGFVGAATLATGTVPGKKFILNFVSDGLSLYESNRTAAL